MSETGFSIGAEGVDVEAVVRDIRETVETKRREGTYDDARIARAERHNLVHLRGDGDFLNFYLSCLREAVFVDISDYDIQERRKGLGPLLVLLKKTIWGLLKFYTYRLWSQQNEVNGLLMTAIEGMDEKAEARIRTLEKRVEELEAQLADRA